MPTRAIVEAAGGAAIVGAVEIAGKFDALIGNRALVARLDDELGFSAR